MRLTLDLPSTHRPKPDVCSCHTELVNVERVFDSQCKIRQGMSRASASMREPATSLRAVMETPLV